MRCRLLVLVVACVLAALSGDAIAQEVRPKKSLDGTRRIGGGYGHRSEQSLPPGDGFISYEMRFGDKVVKGLPYSAQALIESVQTLSDGTHITRKSTIMIYRDSEGRTRREQTFDTIGPFAVEGDAPRQLVFIDDPVADVHYVLDPRNHTARKMRRAPDSAAGRTWPHPSFESKTESLGKQVIEGIEAEGTRSTITIPVGKIGNDRPITIVAERWYSPMLQTVVMSKHSDPRIGETLYRLTNINRSEPARSLFEVPSDYRIEERPFPHFSASRDMKRRSE
jgi:hypothetical protein